MTIPKSAIAALFAAAAAASPLGASSAQTAFDGKTIRIVVNFAAGGPADLLCRQLAPFISKHTPGKPTIVVENRTGAAGIVGANSLFGATKPDGLTIGFMVGITTQGLIGGDNIRFDPARFRWLGSIPQTQVLLARKDLKISAPRDLRQPALPLVLGDTGTTSTTGMSNRLFLNMIGAKYQYVTGFTGQATSTLALARGEISLDNGGLTAYLSRRDSIQREGLYDAILQRGEFNADGSFRRNRLIPEFPTMPEAIAELNPAALGSAEFTAYRSIVGAFAVHFGLVLPPGADDATLTTRRTAVVAALNDPDARHEVEQKLKIPYDVVDGPTSERIVARLRSEFDADPRIGSILNQLMAAKSGK